MTRNRDEFLFPASGKSLRAFHRPVSVFSRQFSSPFSFTVNAKSEAKSIVTTLIKMGKSYFAHCTVTPKKSSYRELIKVTLF